MLRITQVEQPNLGLTLKLEGKLLAPWVEELLRACSEQAGRAATVRLDLAAVTFVDAAGAELLRMFIRQGILITACSGYVAELLLGEKP